MQTCDGREVRVWNCRLQASIYQGLTDMEIIHGNPAQSATIPPRDAVLANYETFPMPPGRSQKHEMTNIEYG